MLMARPICLALERQDACRALSRAWANTGKRIAAKMAIIAITTSSSIRVKPRRARIRYLLGVRGGPSGWVWLARFVTITVPFTAGEESPPPCVFALFALSRSQSLRLLVGGMVRTSDISQWQEPARLGTNFSSRALTCRLGRRVLHGAGDGSQDSGS